MRRVFLALAAGTVLEVAHGLDRNVLKTFIIGHAEDVLRGPDIEVMLRISKAGVRNVNSYACFVKSLKDARKTDNPNHV